MDASLGINASKHTRYMPTGRYCPHNLPSQLRGIVDEKLRIIERGIFKIELLSPVQNLIDTEHFS